ncbi:hypothetical protein ACSMXN_04385 [Jatrophihabitans sp. DSM 45814]
MSESAMAILAGAVLVSLGLWLAMLGARLADVQVLPAHCRRRVRWWQANAIYVQLCCAFVAVLATSVQIGASIT